MLDNEKSTEEIAPNVVPPFARLGCGDDDKKTLRLVLFYCQALNNRRYHLPFRLYQKHHSLTPRLAKGRSALG